MRESDLPVLPDEKFEYRLDLRHHVTPRLLKPEPVHRWFWFPHSFSPQLVDEVLKAFPIPDGNRILDPFVGAGTTVLRAGQLGYEAVGTDLSPLSLFVSRVKRTRLSTKALEEALRFLLNYTPVREWEPLPERLQKAFYQEELAHLVSIQRKLQDLPLPLSDFFRLALLRVLQRVSRAIPDGGWFRWAEKEDQSEQIKGWFEEQARMQIGDMENIPPEKGEIFLDDARQLKQIEGLFHWVITSPPYPNRHDYSRIFHIELLWLGVGEEAVKQFRKESIRSHVQATTPSFVPAGYVIPPSLEQVFDHLPANADTRIAPMLQGYFEDMYLTFKALYQHLLPGAVVAFVVGNVRHAGVMVPVDVILAEVAKQAGYTKEIVWVVRLRGNSAQQMRKFGRKPARESIVILRRE
jgi:hypothetical protein